MSLFNLRRRQVDADKPMQIIFGDLPETELESSHTRGTVEVNVSRMPAEEQGEKHLREILGNARSGQVEAIPTPHVKVLPEYAEEVDRFPLKIPPRNYIRWPDIESNVSHVEYDLDEEDEMWLRQLHTAKGVTISYDDFEYLVDFLEKQEYLYPMLKLNLEQARKEVRPELRGMPLTIVHDYWRARTAAREGKPLLRRFLNHGAEKQPFAAFGQKMIQPQQVQKKRPPIEDERAVARYQYVLSQLLQMRVILAKVLQREELKREKVVLTQHALELLVRQKADPKLAASAPAPVQSIAYSHNLLSHGNGPHSAHSSHNQPLHHATASHPNGRAQNLSSSASRWTSTNGAATAHQQHLTGQTSLESAGIGSGRSGSSPSPSSSTTSSPRPMGSRIVLKTNQGARSTVSQPGQTAAKSNLPPPHLTTPIPPAQVKVSGTLSSRPPLAASPRPMPSTLPLQPSTSIPRAGSPSSVPTSSAAVPVADFVVPEEIPPTEPSEPVTLEGEYALNPENLLRGYPFFGGLKKAKQEDRSRSSSLPPQQQQLQQTKTRLPFSSKDASPFFDPFTGERFDSLNAAGDDEDTIAMEEMEVECEDEEDEVIQTLERTVEELSKALPPSCRLDPDLSGNLLYQPYDSQSMQFTYDPTDTLLRWNKDDVSFLRREWSESVGSPYHPLQFRSTLPSHDTSQLPHSGQPTKADPSSLIHQRAPVANGNSIFPKTPLSSPSSKPALHTLPYAEPVWLPNTQEGYHIFASKPSLSAPLPPRRYQVKIPITKTLVNNTPFRTWKTGADVSVGPYGRLSNEQLSKRPHHDALSDDEQESGSLSSEAALMPPPAKKFKLADGQNTWYSEMDPRELYEDLPSTLFFTAESSSYRTVDLGRTGIAPFRGRKRIGRGGRVMWDRVPNGAFTSPFTVPPSHPLQVAAVTTNPTYPSLETVPPAPSTVPPLVKIQADIVPLLSTPLNATDLPVHYSNNPIHRNAVVVAATSTSALTPNGNATSPQILYSEQQHHCDNMTAVTTPEPCSSDPQSGESTIAAGSGSHSPEESYPNFSSSPASKPDICVPFDAFAVPHQIHVVSNVNDTSLMMMDEPMPENLDDMPWL